MKNLVPLLLLITFLCKPVHAQIHLDEKEAYKVFRDYYETIDFSHFTNQPTFISSEGETMKYEELEELLNLKHFHVDSYKQIEIDEIIIESGKVFVKNK